jgi:hypothetical protein
MRSVKASNRQIIILKSRNKKKRGERSVTGKWKVLNGNNPRQDYVFRKDTLYPLRRALDGIR